jgi:hypothetical protein
MIYVSLGSFKEPLAYVYYYYYYYYYNRGDPIHSAGRFIIEQVGGHAPVLYVYLRQQ